MKTSSQKTFSAVIALSIAFMSPGLGCYQALAAKAVTPGVKVVRGKNAGVARNLALPAAAVSKAKSVRYFAPAQIMANTGGETEQISRVEKAIAEDLKAANDGETSAEGSREAIEKISSTLEGGANTSVENGNLDHLKPNDPAEEAFQAPAKLPQRQNNTDLLSHLKPNDPVALKTHRSTIDPVEEAFQVQAAPKRAQTLWDMAKPLVFALPLLLAGPFVGPVLAASQAAFKDPTPMGPIVSAALGGLGGLAVALGPALLSKRMPTRSEIYLSIDFALAGMMAGALSGGGISNQRMPETIQAAPIALSHMNFFPPGLASAAGMAMARLSLTGDEKPKAQPEKSPAPKPEEFNLIWKIISKRVADKIEGTVTESDSLMGKYTVYEIKRKDAGGERSIAAVKIDRGVLEARIDEFHTKSLRLSVNTPQGKKSITMNVNGSFHPAHAGVEKEFRAQLDWWISALAPRDRRHMLPTDPVALKSHRSTVDPAEEAFQTHIPEKVKLTQRKPEITRSTPQLKDLAMTVFEAGVIGLRAGIMTAVALVAAALTVGVFYTSVGLGIAAVGALSAFAGAVWWAGGWKLK